jgi:hypothetical protein
MKMKRLYPERQALFVLCVRINAIPWRRRRAFCFYGTGIGGEWSGTESDGCGVLKAWFIID